MSMRVGNTDLKIPDVLAFDRTRMAAERTLMAWVRTALSMITFGFTVYKFMQFIREQSTAPVLRPHAPRNFALTLIGIGTFALIVACVQHRTYLRRLMPAQPSRPWDLTFFVACVITLLGVVMFASIVLGAGPFG